MPPARVYFFKLSIVAKGILLANFSPFSLGKGMILPISVKEMSNFGNSCKETHIVFKFWSREYKKFGKLCLEKPTHGTFDVEISLARGIIFTKIGQANGAILKLWVAHPYPKFNWLIYRRSHIT